MADVVEERWISEKKGNGLFARKCFTVGEVIFEESPLVCCQFAWNEDYGYRSCEYCLSPLETAMQNARRLSGNPSLVLPYLELDLVNPANHQPCSNCTVVYCSQTCKDLAWNSYHKTLCIGKGKQEHPLTQIRDAWKNLHYPPESFNIMIIAKLAAMYLQASPVDREVLMRTKLSKFQREFSNADEGIMHKMLGPQFQSQLEILRKLFAVALDDPCLKDWWTPQGFLSIFAMFARNAQGVGTSSFGMWQKTMKEDPRVNEQITDLVEAVYAFVDDLTGTDFMDNEGSALFIRQRGCNHSCEPNTEIRFLRNNSTLSLTATRPIQVGEEIYISYLEECELHRSRHTRQKSLREYYLFNCSCHKCQQQINQADVTSDEEEAEDSDDSDDDPMEED